MPAGACRAACRPKPFHEPIRFRLMVSFFGAPAGQWRGFYALESTGQFMDAHVAALGRPQGMNNKQSHSAGMRAVPVSGAH